MDGVFNKRLMGLWLLTWLLISLFMTSTTNTASASEIDVWEAFNNGEVVALMRHAIAPGNGDPAEFTINDCKTQRNLSKDGQLQAQQIGLQIKEHGIGHADIYTSQWCRCFDTAINLNLGPVQKLPMLNSFYQNRSTEGTQTAQLTRWIVNRLAANNSNIKADQQNATPAILVTHQVNITALTGVFPASGEVVFVAMDNGQLTALSTWVAAR